ncbi:MAG: inorganic diphosphatase, partial [Bacteroidia bacterium]|nr:inorganic diphosphatase [Bacteroidia bacterium]
KGEADDKIIAVMAKDEMYNKWKDISDVPESLLNRLKHYFLTYKNIPGESIAIVEIPEIYGREKAHEVILKSIADYNKIYKSYMELGI